MAGARVPMQPRFGPDVSRNFMQFNGLRMTLRSHEVKAQGYRYDHDGEFPLITVFSAPNYAARSKFARELCQKFCSEVEVRPTMRPLEALVAEFLQGKATEAV